MSPGYCGSPENEMTQCHSVAVEGWRYSRQVKKNNQVLAQAWTDMAVVPNAMVELKGRTEPAIRSWT